MIEMLTSFLGDAGFLMLTIKEMIMIIISCIFLYLAIKRGYEPYLLIPISIGMLLVNLPGANLMKEGGLLFYLYKGVEYGIYPSSVTVSESSSEEICPVP